MTTSKRSTTKRARRHELLVALLLGAFGCGPEIFLSASGLSVTPNPAQGDDVVTFVFTLQLLPEHEFTIIAAINGQEAARLTRTGLVDGPVDIDVGTAAELIATHGVGEHTASVTVTIPAIDRTASGGEATFELQAAPAP